MGWMKKSTPEEHGVASQTVVNFLERMTKLDIRLNSFMLLRDNDIIAEGYWKPFDAEKQHRMYSISKSFTSCAIGILVDEGKLSLDDKVADFFPDKCPKNLHPYTARATVRDLLRMASPHEESTYKIYNGGNWVESFFHIKPSHPPGTVFCYDTSGTHVLGALVERVSGLSLHAFMRDRVLDDIGFSKDAVWLPDPFGVPQAGSGMYCTTRDLARFALLCQHYGCFEDKRYISEEYMKAATTKQIENDVRGLLGSYTVGGWGYGYKFWCGIDDVFVCYGMCGQFAFISPGRRMIALTTADTQVDPGDESLILNAIWEELFVPVNGDILPENAAAHSKMRDQLDNLTLLAAPGKAVSPIIPQITGKSYMLYENPLGISGIKLDFCEDGGTFYYSKSTGCCRLDFGWNKHIRQNMLDGGMDSVVSGGWIDDNTLELWLCVIDATPAVVKILLHFKEREISVCMHKAVDDILLDYKGLAGGIMID